MEISRWKHDLVLQLGLLISNTMKGKTKRKNAANTLSRLAKMLRETSQESLPGVPQQKAPTGESSLSAVTEVFEYWKEKTGRSRATLTSERRGHINARLRDGVSVVDLKKLIDYVAQNPHHQGENDLGKRYDWIKHFMHDTGQVERSLEDIKDRHLCSEPLTATLRRITELEKEALDADTERFNEIQQEIAALYPGGSGKD
jgi:uncharacterized phage protein (TIGR02220 family)